MSTASILNKVRRALRDYGEQFSSTVAGDGVVNRFELPQDTIDPDTFTAAIGPSDGSVPPTTLTSGQYTLDHENGYLSLAESLAQTDLLIVTGTSYETFLDNDIEDYIGWCFQQFTLGRSPLPVIDPTPGVIPPSITLSPLEERAVALLASRDIMRDMATAAASEFTIDTGDGTVVPQAQQYQQYIQQADLLDKQYEELANRLGVQGADTMTVANLRRVSYSTNRLVPLYVAREWDDRNFAKRILPPIDPGIGVEGTVVTYRGQWLDNFQYTGGGNATDEVDWLSARYLALAPSFNVNPATDVAQDPTGKNITGKYWQVTFLNSGLGGYGNFGW